MALKCISTKTNRIPVRIFFTNIFTKRSLCVLKDWEHKEETTHTGQKWSEDDYRLVRFTYKKKLVNPNWAVKLVAEVPPIPIKGRVAWCDGGSGAKGHPKVYINVDKPGCHSCLYCGLRFYKEDGHH